MSDIPDNMVKLGILTGHEVAARKKAVQWTQAMNRLKKQYGKRSGVRVFYQVSDSPLFTLNGKHIVNEAISLVAVRTFLPICPLLHPMSY